MPSYSVIGKPIRNIDALKKATGVTLYTNDMKMPGMLYGKILRSKYAHARILNINIDKAKRLAGVKAVVTGKDIIPRRWGILIKDKYTFAVEKVRFLGEEVAGVVAVDMDTAEEACELIEVYYEELPTVFDPVAAMQEGAPLVHERIEEYERLGSIKPVPNSNICPHLKLRRGDVEAGFQQADYIFEDEFSTQPLSPSPIEPMACIADVDAFGNVTVWSTTQAPYEIRDFIAGALGIPVSRIRIIAPPLGGGFGTKLGVRGELACIAMSQSVRRPVKLVFTREELFTGGIVRHPVVTKIKTGVNKDGTIVARKCTEIYDTGAYADYGPHVAAQGVRTGGGPYNIPNVWVDTYVVYTNNTTAGAMRGFGTTQPHWAIESHMDIIAEKLGLDPLEFRLKNILEEGMACPTGQVAHAVGLKECLQGLKEKGDWKRKKGEKKKYSGIGIACLHKATGTPTSSSAIVKLNQDVSADLLMSATDMGQGSNTVLAQMVAEELGIPVEKVNVVLPDTNVTPHYSSTSGSRTTFVEGNAVRLAALDAKRELLKVASSILEVEAEKLELKDGKVWVKDAPDKAIPLEILPMGTRFTAGAKYPVIGNPIIGKGYYTTAGKEAISDPETGQARKSSIFWMYAADLAEVEIDPDTGQVKIKKIIAAHNVGKAINPLLLEGQTEGGILMGIGDALYEEVVWEEGKTLNPNFGNYSILTFMDTPEQIESIFVEVPHREGPYGCMGIGEVAMVAISAAIGNAIYDATGVRIKELPITSEKIFNALREQRESAAR